MKHILAYTLTALLLCTTLCLGVFADEPITVYVTIADDNGALVLAHEAITVTTDFDFDGTLSIADAIFCAHEAKFEGGADAGFACERTVYGLSLIKLWGIDNGGSFGYYCNNASPMSLSDAIANGDSITVFAYTDLTMWSDTFCYFDAATAKATVGEELTLTLSSAGYDAEWNPVVYPVVGAVITVDGTDTEFVTDENGCVTLTLDEVGSYLISARSDTQTLVPPVCTVSVTNDVPYTGDNGWMVYAALCLISVAAMAVLVATRKRAYEK